MNPMNFRMTAVSWFTLLFLSFAIPSEGASKRNKAKGEVNTLSMAFKSYFSDYGRLPATGFMPDSKEVVRVLNAKDPSMNPRQIVYLELESDQEDGTFVDPWGQQYRLYLDHDYDGKIRCYGVEFRSVCIAQSAGRDEMFGTVDDIFSSGSLGMTLAQSPFRHRSSLAIKRFWWRWNELLVYVGLPLASGLLALLVRRKSRNRWKVALLAIAIMFVLVMVVYPLRPKLI